MTDQKTTRLLRLATRASLATAILLVIIKLGAWFITGSVSMLASLIDSIMDALASFINLLAVGYSLVQADNEHRFGHGKAEPLAGLAQATFIAGSALFLLLHAIDRLQHPQPLTHLTVAISIMIFSIVATSLLITFQRYVIRCTHSTAIRADSLHYVTDMLTNITILVALVLAAYGWPAVDPLFAIGIAIYILYSAWRIGYEAFQLLMDHELPAEIQQSIQAIALAHEEVQGVHDIRTRQSGQTRFIQMHIELAANMSLLKAHAIAKQVEVEVLAAVPNAQVIIHQDPVAPLVE